MAGLEGKVRKILKEAGGKPERNPRGSHVIWSVVCDGETVKVSVPGKIVSRHTANEILKSAGIGKMF